MVSKPVVIKLYQVEIKLMCLLGSVHGALLCRVDLVICDQLPSPFVDTFLCIKFSEVCNRTSNMKPFAILTQYRKFQ